MFKLDTSSHWTVSSDLFNLFLAVIIVFLIYFFSYQIFGALAKFMRFLGEKIGTYSTTKEYVFQRYVYQHSSSPLAKLYNWVNNQLVALGMKRLGVTVTGYLLFWGLVAFVVAVVITILLKFGFMMFPLVFGMSFVVMLVMTRVVVSERMERREADVMDAIDLITPEIKNGVKNAIVTYQDNFAMSVRDDFVAFIANIQDRGYTFEDAMYILADNLGLVFKDFAQKAIYYEAVGEKEMVDIFSDITETNRLRRQLRTENEKAFAGLKGTFIASSLMVLGYFIFLMFTDDFSRYFFLQTVPGKLLLLVIVGVVFGVLAYITTIKSKAI